MKREKSETEKKEFRNLKTHQHRKTTSNIAMMQKKAHNIAQCAGNIHANKWSISRKKKKKHKQIKHNRVQFLACIQIYKYMPNEWECKQSFISPKKSIGTANNNKERKTQIGTNPI